jgi:hypothetical protein
MTEADVEDDEVDMKVLIEKQICPPWLVPTSSYLKRCLPSFDVAPDESETITNETVIVTPEQNGDPDGEGVDAGMIASAMGRDSPIFLKNFYLFSIFFLNRF